MVGIAVQEGWDTIYSPAEARDIITSKEEFGPFIKGTFVFPSQILFIVHRFVI